MLRICGKILRIVGAILLIVFAVIFYIGHRTGKTSGSGSFNFADSGKYAVGSASVDGAKVKNLEINWVSGNVEIVEGSSGKLSFEEKASGSLSNDEQLRWYLDGDTLKIQYCKSGFKLGSIKSKTLKVYVPSSISLKELDLNLVSSSAKVDLGKVSFAKAASVSGDVELNIKHLEKLEAESVSGSVGCSVLSLASAEMNTVSGNLCLYLPEGTGFNAKWSSVSGKFSSNHKGTTDNKSFECGDGKVSVALSSVSGNLSVKVR